MNDSQREAALGLWQAYNAMETTKQRHFDFLTLLENKKKKFNLDPTESDKTLLAQLLRDHDEQVKMFTTESGNLKRSDPAAHVALFVYIGQINEVLDGVRDPH